MTSSIPEQDADSATGSGRRLLRALIIAAQSRVASALGVSRARRTETVVLMLENDTRLAPGYWLQLFLATGIATLGLVLGSTAVVIGGMLVSPLMGPIVELGMGFAVGSSLLVIRSFLRVALSVVGVVVLAALMTLALPFHEVTTEIATRASPTLLDLLVAGFCAIAAAYTTVRQTADTTAAAAGTAIGIALVPPLCVAGFGVGTGSISISGGAALLFTANFSAILLLAVVSFLLLGYNQVDAAGLEERHLTPSGRRVDRLALRAHERLRFAFGSRYGLVMRLAVPLVFLAAVAVPLKRALDEVAWEVRVRDAVRHLIAERGVRAVQSAVTVERHEVSLRLVVIGSPEQASELQQFLETRVAAAAGVAPQVTVTAVPDATALQATMVRSTRKDASGGAGVPLAAAEEQVATALTGVWPRASAGRLVSWTLEVVPNESSRLILRHLGAPIGPVAEAMLTRSLISSLQAPIRVVDVALPPTDLTPNDSFGGTDWLTTAVRVLEHVPRVDSAMACVQRPRRRGVSLPATPGMSRPTDAMVEAMLGTSAAARAGRLEWSTGATWAIRVAIGPCVPGTQATDSAAKATPRR